ncbi:MAG: succinate dehydrogenase cytochrome b subunit [Spirochaetia bacterium]|nr:succinate dehydrogenase cytochrome b subunit [Spirochaetia bacterium]
MSYDITEYKNTIKDTKKWLADGLSRSTGKKFLMAMTGLFLITFLMVHLFGNLLLLVNDNGISFNEYSKNMSHSKIIRVMEIFLFTGFIFHIGFGATVSIQNRLARKIPYAVIKSSETSSFFSRYMFHTGSLVFIFLLLHLNSFFIPHRVLESGLSMYESALIVFHNPLFVLFYIFAMILLSFHLMHGFQSAFQSLGIHHNKYTPSIKLLGRFFALVVPLVFAVIPVYIYFWK